MNLIANTGRAFSCTAASRPYGVDAATALAYASHPVTARPDGRMPVSRGPAPRQQHQPNGRAACGGQQKLEHHRISVLQLAPRTGISVAGQ
ncbi:hypothetical protein D3C74_35340 [compost metagenome]